LARAFKQQHKDFPAKYGGIITGRTNLLLDKSVISDYSDFAD
jgi:hypothetical protein